MKGVNMRRLFWMAAIGAIFALVTGLALPARVHAGATEADKAKLEAEKTKLVDLMKAQMVMQRGEHEQMHAIMDQLLKKYPQDPEIKALDDFHEKWHSRAKMQEEVQERVNTFLESGSEE
jgi:hypothetical protein